MQIDLENKALIKLAKFFDVEIEEMANKCKMLYMSLEFSEDDDAGSFLDFLEEEDIFWMSKNIIEFYFNRKPESDEITIVSCLLEEIEMI